MDWNRKGKRKEKKRQEREGKGKKNRKGRERKDQQTRLWILFRIKANFSKKDKWSCLTFWHGFQNPEVIAAPVLIQSLHVKVGPLNPLHFPFQYLPWAVCSPSPPREPGSPLRTSLSHLPIVKNKVCTVFTMNVSQCQRHNYWNHMETKNDNSCEAPKSLRLLSQSIWTASITSSGGKRFSVNYPQAGCAVGRRGESLPGTKARGLASASDLAWRGLGGGSFIFCSYFIFKICSCSSQNSLKSMTVCLFRRQAVADG